MRFNLCAVNYENEGVIDWFNPIQTIEFMSYEGLLQTLYNIYYQRGCNINNKEIIMLIQTEDEGSEDGELTRYNFHEVQDNTLILCTLEKRADGKKGG
jgi:hypothetical protein